MSQTFAADLAERATMLRTRGGVDGRLVYAIGDIHGGYELMKILLARLAADYGPRARGRRPLLVFCGDYVDRGPHSAQVLEALVWLQRRGEIEVRLLKGNHEQAMLAFLDQPRDGGGWLRFGGDATLISYGVLPPAPDEGPEGFDRARDDLLERMPASHLRLLQDLELMVLAGDYAFVHAGIRPGAPLAGQTEDDLLWIRQPFLEIDAPFEKVIVHGHTWIGDQAQVLDHRIGLDTGAFATGVLTAARFEDGEMTLLPVSARETRSPESSW
jgi:serine/threonine protein phosphatase 1